MRTYGLKAVFVKVYKGPLKIVSGGQTGADLAGLVAAKRLGLNTGGVAPKGFRTEKGPQPILGLEYNLEESDKISYPPRTEENVRISDATAIFSSNEESRGTQMTYNFSVKHNKPCIIINPFSKEAVSDLKSWLIENQPETLNIAGNRESVSKGITKITAAVITKTINDLIQASSRPTRLPGL